MNETTPRELLTTAWNASSSDSLLDQLSRMSLGMSAVNRPDLVPTLTALSAGRRTELDLHLEGAGVSGHETGAEWFGRFVTRTATAVKEVVKSKTGKLQYPTNLLLVAPSPGSVRVVFRSPPPAERPVDVPMPEVPTDTVEGDALRTVVDLIGLAEAAGPDTEELDQSLHRLHGGARNAVRLMAQAVVEGKWSVAGQLRRGDGRRTDITLTEAGAQRLSIAANVSEADVSPNNVVVGVVDGWVWSEGQMTFLPEGSRPFKATVPDELQQLVAHLVDTRHRARAVVTIYTTYPPGDEHSASRSYELTSIAEDPGDPQLDYSDNVNEPRGTDSPDSASDVRADQPEQ